MAFEKKTWTDRIAEFINRRTLTKEDGSTELVTVARSEGTISAEGDAFNAETMNDLEQRIADGFNEVNTNLANKQNKLTNPLTQSDVVNNLTSTATNKPLSAVQGTTLKAAVDTLNNKTGNVGQALKMNGYANKNLVYANYDFGIYYVVGDEEGLPVKGYSGFMVTLKFLNSRFIKILILVNTYTYVLSQDNDGTVIVGWTKLNN